jgi:hypothetical protein
MTHEQPISAPYLPEGVICSPPSFAFRVLSGVTSLELMATR